MTDGFDSFLCTAGLTVLSYHFSSVLLVIISLQCLVIISYPLVTKFHNHLQLLIRSKCAIVFLTHSVVTTLVHVSAAPTTAVKAQFDYYMSRFGPSRIIPVIVDEDEALSHLVTTNSTCSVLAQYQLSTSPVLSLY